MKVNGKKLDGPRIVKVYLPVGDDEGVEFRFRALRATEDFEKVMSLPKPPEVIKPGGVRFANEDDPRYKVIKADWLSKKLDWEFLTSISETVDLNWETVFMDQPNTWKNWKVEAAEHFGDHQLNKLFGCYLDAQYVTEESMERARVRFLTSRLDQASLLHSQTDVVTNTPSGEPANV